MFNKGQLAGLMQKAQEAQKNIQRVQEEIALLEVEGDSGSGVVKVLMNGSHHLKKINIDNSLLDDKEMLEDLILVAVNDAVKKIEVISKQKMDAVSAGIPGGGFNLSF